MKAVVGLGNPGPEYDAHRHNVGWWTVDRLAYDWDLPSFEREGKVLVTGGTVGGTEVRLLKPLTWMNRSGAALAVLAPGASGADPGFDATRDLLVVVDDASLDVGRVRIRPEGGAGGHNGLKSVESVLGSRDYARLRIGVGRCPDGVDLADWVLSSMPDEDEETVVALLPELTKAVELWLEEGAEAAMNRFNR